MMIRFYFLLIINFFFAVQCINAQNVKAFLNYGEYFSPKDGQFIETYVAIEGNSLQWNRTMDNNLKAQVEYTLIFKLDSQIVGFSKDIINSPLIQDSAQMGNMLLHTNRFKLQNGKYSVSIKLDDLNDTLKASFTTTQITLKRSTNDIFMSSIEVFSKFEKTEKEGMNIKGGYLLTPNVYHYLPEHDSVLQFYTEIYHTKLVLGMDVPFLLSYYLVNNESNIILPQYKKYKRLKSSEVNVFMSSLDIRDLPSGNFSLVMEVRDRNNELKAKTDYFFQRQNSKIVIDEDEISAVNIASTFAELITGEDTLSEIIRSLAPISSGSERVFALQLIDKGDTYIMQQYLFNFWEKRNLEDPFKPFREYMEQVRKADKKFGTSIKRGYETDRGRVFLQYGEPNSIAKEDNDPAAYPYEIWHYYQALNQRDVKFVFYNTDLTSNDFYLLHSTAIGEPNDYQWRLHLRGRDRKFNSIDDDGRTDDWGSEYNNYYENPR